MMALEAARAIMQSRGEVVAPGLGRSMGAAFMAVDALVIVPLLRPPALGAVVVFERADRWVAHRLLGVWRGRAFTQGDALWRLDWPPCRRTDIEGTVVAVIRGGRRIPVHRSRLRMVRGWARVLAWLISRAWRR
jgi:hypothetical protein